jgi:hypothetical protein
MLPYFPFETDTWALTFGVRPLGAAPLLEVDPARYGPEVAERRALLAADARYHAQALPGTGPMQWEALALVLRALARQHPAHFGLEEDAAGGPWRWTNRLLGTRESFVPGDAATLPHPPLHWLGGQVQEDLLLLDGAAPGWPLVAGVLCFAAGWCLDEKLGRPLLEVHAPVPGYAGQLARPVDGLMERLRPERPVMRVNWGLGVTDALDRSPRTAARWAPLLEGITAQNAGERCFLRLERQTLSRLAASRAVLFTIHTWCGPVAAEARDPWRRQRLASVLRSVPPATRAYKGLDPFLGPLLAWLEAGR